MDLQTNYQNWIETTNTDFDNVEILGNNIAIQVFFFEHEANNNLTDLEGNLLSKKYGKEIFNVAKVLKTGTDYSGPLKPNDIVSLLDESLDPIADPSQGFQPDGTPNAGYVPLGRLLPFTYLKNKLTQPKQDLYFIISPAWISVRHLNPMALSTQQEVDNN
jgi:hypothetical protein